MKLQRPKDWHHASCSFFQSSGVCDCAEVVDGIEKLEFLDGPPTVPPATLQDTNAYAIAVKLNELIEAFNHLRKEK